MTRVRGGLSIEVDGLKETLKAVSHVEAELRPTVNSMIRDAADRCAGELVPLLAAAAASSPTPVARRVARSIKVKRDRMPTVSIGGNVPVGAGGARAGVLVWGSEKGPAGPVNHFGAPPAAGYWIKPAVERFQQGPAVKVYLDAIAATFREAGLL